MKKAVKWIFGLAIAGTAAWFFFGEELGISDKILREFAIKDTARVTKIFIADTENNSIQVERQDDGSWWVITNGVKDFRARNDAIFNILKTVSRIEVKQPVPKPALNNVIRLIAGRHSMVEIYTGDDEPEKIWYVGGATQDSQGTYMLLEIPGKGKSSVPFITHISGSYGYLSSRFFTTHPEWRHSGVFDRKIEDIARIKVDYPPTPGNSFELRYSGGNDLSLYSDSLKTVIPRFDTVAAKNYMLQFKKIHYESIPQHLNDRQQDSLLATQPVFSIEVTYRNGEQRSIRAHRMEVNTRQENSEQGEGEQPFNVDRLYGYVNDELLVIIQYFVFDPLLAPITQFLK